MANKKIELPVLERKTRTYVLKLPYTPITFQLRSRHIRQKPLQWFDGNYNRSLRYCSNQLSLFVDRQDDNALLEPIVFEDGKLIVREEDNLLQVFLAIHPDNGVVFEEFDPGKKAEQEYDELLVSVDAQAAARDMDITELEAIARVIYRSKVDKMTSSEIKRDMMIFSKNNPQRFLNLANDPNIKLRNLAVRSIDYGIVELQNDGRTAVWSDTGEVIISIGFGENMYSSLASYFQTDEGMDAMESITSKLS